MQDWNQALLAQGPQSPFSNSSIIMLTQVSMRRLPDHIAIFEKPQNTCRQHFKSGNYRRANGGLGP